MNSFVVMSVVNGLALDAYDKEISAANFADALNREARQRIARVVEVTRNAVWATGDPGKVAQTLARATTPAAWMA